MGIASRAVRSPSRQRGRVGAADSCPASARVIDVVIPGADVGCACEVQENIVHRLEYIVFPCDARASTLVGIDAAVAWERGAVVRATACVVRDEGVILHRPAAHRGYTHIAISEAVSG